MQQLMEELAKKKEQEQGVLEQKRGAELQKELEGPEPQPPSAPSPSPHREKEEKSDASIDQQQHQPQMPLPQKQPEKICPTTRELEKYQVGMEEQRVF